MSTRQTQQRPSQVKIPLGRVFLRKKIAARGVKRHTTAAMNAMTAPKKKI